MAGGFPQVQPGNVRAVDQVVPLSQVLVLPVSLYDVANNGALWVPQDEAWSSRLSQAE